MANIRKIIEGLGIEIVSEREDGEVMACCPFHSDSHPSFSINLNTGLWNCYSGCFPSGTQITVRRRKRWKNQWGKSGVSAKEGSVSIEKICLGDETLTYNESTGRKEWCDVIGRFGRLDSCLLKLLLSNGNEIDLTPEHPVYVVDEGWKLASELEIGDSVVQYKFRGIGLRIKSLSGYVSDEERKNRSLAHLRKFSDDPTYRKKISESVRRRWRDGSFDSIDWKIVCVRREKKRRERENNYVEKKLANLIPKSFRPNRSESYLAGILGSIAPEEFKYNDGWLILEKSIPDFVNVNGKKKLIEFAGEYWHNSDYEQQRIDKFRKYGFDTLVIWGNELEEWKQGNKDLLTDRILEFIYNPDCQIVTVMDISSRTGLFPVYNLEINKNNNYFAYGVLVHNCGGGTLQRLIAKMKDIPIGSIYLELDKERRNTAKKEHRQIQESDIAPYSLALGNKFLLNRGLGNTDVTKWELRDTGLGILFPIRDAEGSLVGSAVRKKVIENGESKYRYNLGFNRNRTLYGLNYFPKRFNFTILVEGLFDVINMHRNGYDSTLGLLGTHIAKEQIEILKQLGVSTVALLLDNDIAGKEATKKNAEKLIGSFTVLMPDYDSYLAQDPGEMGQWEMETVIENMQSILKSKLEGGRR